MGNKELRKSYKEILQPMGIYQIKNLVTGRIFLAFAKDLRGKMNSSKFQLNHGSHFNRELQKEYNEYGESNFQFDVIDTLEPKEDPAYNYTDDLRLLESLWLKKLQPYDDKGYHKKK